MPPERMKRSCASWDCKAETGLWGQAGVQMRLQKPFLQSQWSVIGGQLSVKTKNYKQVLAVECFTPDIL